MSKVVLVKLGDIATITNGSSDVKDAKSSGAYPFFDRSTIIKRSNKFLFNAEAIIIPGEDSKEIFEPRYFNGKFDLHQRCYALYDFKNEYNTKYFFYKLKTLTKHFKNMFVGSTVPSLRVEHITELNCVVPSLQIQNAIAKILSYIDCKIEINNVINSELEKLAKTIYDYWFVQFDFPDKDGKPYKSSGGEMVYNQTLKREIPKGWTAERLDKLLKFEKGIEVGANAYSDEKLTANYIKFYRVANIDGTCETYIDKTNYNARIVNINDVIVTFDGTVGKVGFSLEGAISSGLQKISDNNNKISNATIWQIFLDERIQKTILKYSSGSLLRHASSSIEYLVIPYNYAYIVKFQQIIGPVYEQIIKNKKQNIELAALRDFLLPLLMNGQVTIKPRDTTKTQTNTVANIGYQDFINQVGLAARGDIDEQTMHNIYKAHCEKVSKDEQSKNRKSRS